MALPELLPDEPPMPVPEPLLPPLRSPDDEPPIDDEPLPEAPLLMPLPDPDAPPLIPLLLEPDVPPVPPVALPDVLPPVLPDNEPSLLEPLDAPRPACPGGTPDRDVALSLLPGVRPSVRDAALPLRPGSLAVLEPLLWLKETLETPSASAAEVTTNAVFNIDDTPRLMDDMAQRRRWKTRSPRLCRRHATRTLVCYVQRLQGPRPSPRAPLTRRPR